MNDKKIRKIQTAFRMYIKNFNIDKNLTIAGCAEYLGVSKPTVEKWLSKTEPCTVVTSFQQLVKFAGLRDITVQAFCSIMMGGRNEIGELSSFSVEIAELLAGLDNETQLVIHKAVKKQHKQLESNLPLIKDILEASPAKNKLYNEITSLSEEKATALLSLIESFKED